MRIQCQWQGEMRFLGSEGELSVKMDAKPPLGESSALSPKQLLLASVCGCTAMDVVALLKKYKQKVTQFEVSADAPLTQGSYPVVFQRIHLLFQVSGEVEPSPLIEAVQLSQTRYCGVSAMVSKVVPIFYSIELNGVKIKEGQSQFNF